MSTNKYQAFQPGAEGERSVDEAPPAFNPYAVTPMDYTQMQATYGSVPGVPIPQQQPGHIAQPVQPAIVQYVNQYGEPIQNLPIVVVPPQNVPQTMISTQPQKAALIRYTLYYDYRAPNKKNKRKRCCAAVLGLISCILLVMAMNSHVLAVGTEDDDYYECNVLYVYTDNDEVSKQYAYYAEFCVDVDDDESWDNWEDTDSSNWCQTWQGAVLWTMCVIFGGIMSCLATCWVQPLCVMDRCCCSFTCPRIFYVFGLIFCILGNVLWVTNDEVCLDDDGFDLDVGPSFKLVMASCSLIFLALFCAK